jgi:hypothetical protein
MMTGRRTGTSLLFVVTALASCVVACGGGTDESTIALEQLTSIASTESVDGTQLAEEIIEDEERLWEAVRDGDYAGGWKGGYRAQYTDVAGDIQRVEVSIDVYETKNEAQRRAAAEQRLNDEFLKDSLAPTVVVEEFEDETGIEACSALSITHPAIVPQYEVYCVEGTAIVFAKAIGTNEATATEAATRLAKGITEAIQAASSAESSEPS